MAGEPDREWSIGEIAERIRVIDYSSAYQLLKRLFNDTYCARIDKGDPHPGQPSVFYTLTPKGTEKAKVVLAAMPQPIQALTSWVIDPGDEEQAAA